MPEDKRRRTKYKTRTKRSRIILKQLHPTARVIQGMLSVDSVWAAETNDRAAQDRYLLTMMESTIVSNCPTYLRQC